MIKLDYTEETINQLIDKWAAFWDGYELAQKEFLSTPQIVLEINEALFQLRDTLTKKKK